MKSVLKMLLAFVRRGGHTLKDFFQFVRGIVTSALSWLVLGISWAVHTLVGWLGQYTYDFFQDLAEASLGGLQTVPLATFLARDVVALDVAWECTLIGFGIWVVHRIARLSVVWIRTILDVI